MSLYVVVEIHPAPPDPEKEELPVVSVVEAGEEIIQIQVVDENGEVQQVWDFIQNWPFLHPGFSSNLQKKAVLSDIKQKKSF